MKNIIFTFILFISFTNQLPNELIEKNIHNAFLKENDQQGFPKSYKYFSFTSKLNRREAVTYEVRFGDSTLCLITFGQTKHQNVVDVEIKGFGSSVTQKDSIDFNASLTNFELPILFKMYREVC